ncbi:hypothetical protein BDW22DRAFT_1322917 [Trametopsis cervina]|nr:hypothetical protein BDW22DRAFT_1322917 [Trametopsis cervina]
MPAPRNWLAPPSRREVTLLIFSLTVFVLSYNLETSLRLVGVNPSKLSSSYLGAYCLYMCAVLKDPGFERDGRRPQAWRDDLENIIAGDWVWEEGEIAGVNRGQVGVDIGAGTTQRTIYNVGKKYKASRSAGRRDPGIGLEEGTTIDDQHLHLDGEIPETSTVAHIPGYTILNNLYMLNGSFYIVTDSPGSVPPVDSIASTKTNPRHPTPPTQWHVMTTAQANATFGGYIGRIRRTTWLSTEPADSQDPYTLFSLFRAYSHLSVGHQIAKTSDTGLRIISPSSVEPTNVAPPMRLWFPRIPVFSSPALPAEENVHNAHPPPRQRAYTGLHPDTVKAVLPTVALMYQEEWADYADMHIPYLFERVLIADRAVADIGRESWSTRWQPMLNTHAGPAGDELRKRQINLDELNQDGLPAWAAPFVGFDAPERWWAPARAALLSYIGLPSETDTGIPKGRKPVVTFVSMEEEPYEAGPHIRTEDYPDLIAGLRKLAKDGVISEFHVVKSNGTKESWEERMKIITRTDIILGAFGHALDDSMFMPAPLSRLASTVPDTRPAPLIMEFWPSSAFLRDREFSAKALGMRYMAWWDER